MPEQLTIFGLWERVVPEPLAPAPPPPPPPPPAPIDPRQADLLSGPQSMRAALEIACEALDAEGVRARHAALTQRFLGQTWAAHAPAWADGIEWLVGAPLGSLSVDEAVARTLAFGDGEPTAMARFPSLPAYLIASLRAESRRRAAARLFDRDGPLALTPDGEPVARLLVLAGLPSDLRAARAQLSQALAASTPRSLSAVGSIHADVEGSGAPARFPRLRALGLLADAAARDGDPAAALAASVRYFLAGGTLRALDAPTESVLELTDLAAELELEEPHEAWVPVLADLEDLCVLDSDAEAEAELSPEEAPRPRKLAAALAAYRRVRRELRERGGGEEARLEAKRLAARLAPPSLRERLRKI